MSPRNIVLAALIAGAAFAPAALPAQPQPAQSRPASILLVGASGMIGSRILTEAAGRGHPVLAAARHPGDPSFTALIEDLQRDSEHVRAWWPRHDVRAVGRRDVHGKGEALNDLALEGRLQDAHPRAVDVQGVHLPAPREDRHNVGMEGGDVVAPVLVHGRRARRRGEVARPVRGDRHAMFDLGVRARHPAAEDRLVIQVDVVEV